MLTLFKDPLFSPFGLMKDYQYDNFPNVDIKKNDDGYELRLAVPGLKSDDLSLSVKDDILKISYEKEEKDEKMYFMSSFEKSYTLPDYINSNKIKAKVENGVLEVLLPLEQRKLTEKVIKIE